MTDFPYQIIGFDLDGTLLDTSPELTVSVNHTLGL
ncbi:MAG: phosphoglycolate phosphatase, partial [Pseudomonadota bacterium]